MDKRVILAVAGSGKTTYIINDIEIERKSLIITYTRNNFNNIREKIIKKYGYFPNSIKLFTFFEFLYSFCYKPFLHGKIKAKGLNFKPNNNWYAKGLSRYIDAKKRLYSNKLSKLFFENKYNTKIEITNRLSKYFDAIYIDEIQDFSGNDFNFLNLIVSSNNQILFVGDFYQHTYSTSYDGNTNKNLHANFENYISQLKQMGLTIDTDTLKKSYRCSLSTCDFISTNLKIDIESHKEENTPIEIVKGKEDIINIFNNPSIVKLFYQKHYSYDCYSKNWGDSKGEDKYDKVCVVLNNNTQKYFKNEILSKLASTTKNKLYVAISRARSHLYFIEEKKLKKLIEEN